MRTIAIALGLPMLFTVERGNLILVAFAFFMIAHGPVTSSKPWRWFAAAVTINFKPYLVLPMLAHAVKRDWRPLEVAGITTVALYLVTKSEERRVGQGCVSTGRFRGLPE